MINVLGIGQDDIRDAIRMQSLGMVADFKDLWYRWKRRPRCIRSSAQPRHTDWASTQKEVEDVEILHLSFAKCTA
jgi:hypothetical protein